MEKKAKSKKMALVTMMLNKERQRRRKPKDRLMRLSKGLKPKLRKPKIELKRKGVDKRRSVARKRLLNRRNNYASSRKTTREKDLCSNRWRMRGNRKWRDSAWSSKWPRKKLRGNSNSSSSEMVTMMMKSKISALISKMMMKLT